MPYKRTVAQGRPGEAVLPAAGTGRSGHSVAGWGRPDTGVPGVVGTAATGAAGGALGQVVAGVRGGAGLEEFRAGIEAGRRALGQPRLSALGGGVAVGGAGCPCTGWRGAVAAGAEGEEASGYRG